MAAKKVLLGALLYGLLGVAPLLAQGVQPGYYISINRSGDYWVHMANGEITTLHAIKLGEETRGGQEYVAWMEGGSSQKFWTLDRRVVDPATLPPVGAPPPAQVDEEIEVDPGLVEEEAPVETGPPKERFPVVVNYVHARGILQSRRSRGPMSNMLRGKYEPTGGADDQGYPLFSETELHFDPSTGKMTDAYFEEVKDTLAIGQMEILSAEAPAQFRFLGGIRSMSFCAFGRPDTGGFVTFENCPDPAASLQDSTMNGISLEALSVQTLTEEQLAYVLKPWTSRKVPWLAGVFRNKIPDQAMIVERSEEIAARGLFGFSVGGP